MADGTLTSRNVILGLLAAAGLAALFVVAVRPKAIMVDTAAASRTAMRVTVDEEGRTRVRNVFAVSAPVSGRVLRSDLEPGDMVVRSQTVVATIEETTPMLLDVRARREIEAQIAAAQSNVSLGDAELRQAEAELVFATRELARAQQLSRTNVIAERTLERARLDADAKSALVARSKAALEVRRRELDMARAKMTGPQLNPTEGTRDETACCVHVRSPVSGRVLRRIHDSERVAAAGTALVEIGDIEDLEIVADLLSTDAVKVRVGAAVSVENWGGERPLDARVKRIEPAGFTKTSALGIEEQRVRIVFDILTPLAGRAQLGHDYRVLARIELWASPDVLTIPLGALFRHEAHWAVFVFDQGVARLQLVEIAHRNNMVAEVVRGLEPGEDVLLHPNDKVRDGVRVVRRPQTQSATDKGARAMQATVAAR